MHEILDQIDQSKFAMGDRVVIQGKEERILKVVEAKGSQIKLRQGDLWDDIYAEFWEDEEQLEYPNDQSLWSRHQKDFVKALEEVEEQHSFYPGLLGISNKTVVTVFCLLFLLAIATNTLLNEGQRPVHPLSNLLGLGALISIGTLAWNFSKQRDDFTL